MKTYNSSQDLFRYTTFGLLTNPEFKCKPRDMFIHETIGFNARIDSPNNRLISIPMRKWDIVYSLGELLWYLTSSSTLEMISYYAPSYDKFSDNGINLYGAYGPRIMSDFSKCTESSVNMYNLHIENGLNSVVRKLKEDPDSRQAVLLIWREEDMHIMKTKDLPCTMTLQFFIREGKLNLIVNMRSNDVWLGTTNDIFCFTMIQELIASKLNIPMGFYQHNSGSMHLYQREIDKITNNYKPEDLLNYNSNSTMEIIPDLSLNLSLLIRYERKIREGFYDQYLDNINETLDKEKVSNQMKDLIFVFLYGRIRKLLKKSDPEQYKSKFPDIIKNIKQSNIVKCIKNYEGETIKI